MSCTPILLTFVNMSDIKKNSTTEDELYRFLDKRVGDEASLLAKEYSLNRKAASSIAGLLRRRLISLTAPVVSQMYQDQIKKINPLAECSDIFVNEEQRTEAVRLLSSALSDISDIFREYPKLQYYCTRITDNFRNFMKLFFMRLSENRKQIEQILLKGKEMGEAVSFSADGADCHMHGACALKVETEGGSFFYKPRDCSINVMYNEIIEAVFKGMLVSPSLVKGEGFAFEEAVEIKPVSSEAEVSMYYRNFGYLLALFGALGSTDMHYENIIAYGGFPVAVDLETIVTPLADLLRDTDLKSIDEINEITLDLHLSVANTMVLPTMLQGKVQMSPLIKEDALSLPELNGKRIAVFGYEQELIRGYEQGYDLILEHRQDILDILSKYGGISTRYVLRASSYYAITLNELHSPDFLNAPDKAEHELDKLNDRFSYLSPGEQEKLTTWERECMDEGDIPYFSVRADSKDLYAAPGSEPVARDFFGLSPVEHAVKCIGRMGDAEKRFELGYIRARLAQGAAFSEDENEAPETPEAASCIKDEEALRRAESIFDDIVSSAVISTKGAPFYLSRDNNMIPDYIPGLQKGIQGMSLFFDALARSGSPYEGKAAETFEEVVRDTGRCIERSLSYRGSSVIPAGVDLGLAGYMLSPALTGEQAELVLELALKNEPGKNDISEGCAGLITGLDRLRRSGFMREKSASYMKKLALKLVEAPGEEGSRVSGLFYGEAGKAYALALCYEATGMEIFAEHAGIALEYEYSQYNEGFAGWPDLTVLNRPLIPAYGLRTGAPGICIGAARACRAGCGREDLVRLAADSICKKGILDTDELSSGNSGAVLALIAAYELLKDDRYIQEAGHILKVMTLRAEKYGGYRVIPKRYRNAFDPSFLEGYAGIGYALLCYRAGKLL